MAPSFTFVLQTAALLLCWMPGEVRATSIWHISIWEAPAPPAEEGAPLAASALRNLSYLPAQIAAVVAAYVLSLLVIGSALLFVGRRLRRAAQASPTTLAMEMMKPVKPNIPRAFDPSPITPATGKNMFGPSPADTLDMKNNWPSPIKSRRASSTWGSTKKGHMKRQPSVQSSVVSFDESVIADDKDRNEREMERLYAAVREHDEAKAGSQTNLQPHGLQQHPPELQHLRDAGPSSPTATWPAYETPARTATTSPRSMHRPTPISIHSRNSSRSSLGSFSKKRSLRNLTISPPMGSPGIVPDKMYSEHEPLSPRVYDDPGPPPRTPPAQRAHAYREDRLSPRDARFPEHAVRIPRSPISVAPPIPSIPEAHQADAQSLDARRIKRTPAPLALKTSLAARTTTNLALRTAPLPLRNQTSDEITSDRPGSIIKATVLETKPQGHSLRTPRTGVPMTPYSPYMPFTPLTPMTPGRLVTRAERKQKEREQGRRVVTAEDAVIEEDDTWGNAYA